MTDQLHQREGEAVSGPKDLPLVPGGSDRDAVVRWFSGCMDGSSAARRATAILDSLLQQARAAALEEVAEQVRADEVLCLWEHTNRGETTYCGLYQGHPWEGVQYGHHFVASSVLPPAVLSLLSTEDGS